jgi:site-specific DNA-methyltransferase (adenine-specific)
MTASNDIDFPIKTNTLFQGDNIFIMSRLPSEFVDIVYLDPPFFTQKNYKNIWGDQESVDGFNTLDFPLHDFQDTKDYFEKHIHSGAKGLAAYLEWLRCRLYEVHRLMKPGANIFLHLDYHAVHYAKVIMDEIFGYNNFKNEIVWRRKTGGNSTTVSRKLSCNFDTILFYSKKGPSTFNPQYTPHTEKYLSTFYKHDDKDGKGPYQCDNLASPSLRPNLIYEYKGYLPPKKGWRVSKARMEALDNEGRLSFPKDKTKRIRQKRYLSQMKGNELENIWTDIGMIQDSSKEKTGWPTQKPVALLERILAMGSNEGDLVFDCFAGCGTSLHAAHRLNRRWVGIDISSKAVEVNKDRLEQLGAKVSVVLAQDIPGHQSSSLNYKKEIRNQTFKERNKS